MSWKKTDAGELVTVAGYISLADAGRWVGQPLITASGQATTISDFQIPYDCKVKGAHFWSTPVSGYNANVSADFQVVDKDDVLGLFALYGLQEGEVLELTKYVEGGPLAPCFNSEDYMSEAYAEIVSGLYLRCTIDNEGDIDMHMGITYVVYR